MTNMHTVQAWDIVRRLADDADQAEHFIDLQDQARALLAQVNTEAELRKALEASETARRRLQSVIDNATKSASFAGHSPERRLMEVAVALKAGAPPR